jgi:hypothetical protein
MEPELPPKTPHNGLMFRYLTLIALAAAVCGMTGCRPAGEGEVVTTPDPPAATVDASADGEGLVVGRSAPPLQVAEWLNSDRDLSLDALRGSVVLLDFWAHW